MTHLLTFLALCVAGDDTRPQAADMDRFPPVEVLREWSAAAEACVKMCERNRVMFPGRGWDVAYDQAYRRWNVVWYLMVARDTGVENSRRNHLAAAKWQMDPGWWENPWRVECIPYSWLPPPPRQPTPSWFFARGR